MNIDSPFIASGESPHPAQPGKGSFDNPAMTPEPLTILYTSTSNAGLNATPSARSAATSMIVCLVRMEFVGATARPPRPTRRNRWNAIKQSRQWHTIVHVGSREQDSQRDSLAIGQ
jgi:hypothetical protein